jgi:signal peptidase I
MRRYLRLAAVVSISIVVGWIFVRAVQFSIVDFARVANESMLPYLKPGQIILINKFKPCLKLPFTELRFFCGPCTVGRAYLFPHPAHPRQKLVKFAAAVPRETKTSRLQRDIIWFTHGAPLTAQSASVAGTCYFEGSNRENSIDSRQFGAIPLEKIEGEIIYPHIKR